MINSALDIWSNFYPSPPLSFKRLSFQPRILASKSFLLSSLPSPQANRFHTHTTFAHHCRPCTSCHGLRVSESSTIDKLEPTKRLNACPVGWHISSSLEGTCLDLMFCVLDKVLPSMNLKASRNVFHSHSCDVTKEIVVCYTQRRK